MKKTLLLNVALLAALGVSSVSARSLDAHHATDRDAMTEKANKVFTIYQELGLDPATGRATKESKALAAGTGNILTTAQQIESVQKLLAKNKAEGDLSAKVAADSKFAAELVAAIVNASKVNTTLNEALTTAVETAKAKAQKAEGKAEETKEDKAEGKPDPLKGQQTAAERAATEQADHELAKKMAAEEAAAQKARLAAAADKAKEEAAQKAAAEEAAAEEAALEEAMKSAATLNTGAEVITPEDAKAAADAMQAALISGLDDEDDA